MVMKNIDTAVTTIVQLNNGALSHFINRDYEKAIIMLRRAYEVFEVCSQLQDLKTTSESSSTSSAMDMDTDTTSSSSAPSSSSAISSSIQADCFDNNSIQFMQYDMNGGDDDDAVSSSSSSPTQEHHQQQGQQQQQQQQQQLPTARKLGGLGGVDFEMDSTLFKEKVVRSSQIEPTANYACSPDTAYSMYNRALLLSDEENVHSLIIGNSKYRTAAIILYNLALVHHTIGIQLGLSAALPHAIRLYEMALESIILGCCCCSITSSSSSSVQNLSLLGVEKLFMALLNNLGNIYTHIFEYENAQRCFNHLRVVLSTFGGSSGESSQSALGAAAAADEEYTFFFLNAIFQGKELCIAPAA